MRTVTRVYYDEDADLGSLRDETVAVLGYGIQGRAQALCLRDSGVSVIVGNRDDAHGARARVDGFDVVAIDDAVRRGTLVAVLLPDEVQPEVYAAHIAPALRAGHGLVFAHGFAVRYELVDVPDFVDLMLLAPRMPGHQLRRRFVAGWGVPAFVCVERDASGRARAWLLALARALGVTRCGALEVSFAAETELDHFSEHFTFPLIFRTLELALETLVAAGYPPEVALMELHGSGELGEVLKAAGELGLTGMIESHASPACQVGMAHHWERAVGPEDALRARMLATLEAIRDGSFARHLRGEQARGYPELTAWRRRRPAILAGAEARLGELLRKPPATQGASDEALG
jgi:ketol-acid reductoisomerase